MLDNTPHSAARTDQASAPASWRPGLVIVLLLIGAALGAGGYRWIAAPPQPAAASTSAARAPSYIRDGTRIAVPDSSPLRSKLVIAPVDTREIRRSLTLPAVVEADPAHLIKVLPPLAGRIVQLKAQLGARVAAGDPLAVIDSPDLGSAYADYDRAKAQLTVTQTNRDRQRNLVKLGGAAQKDAEQAESDYLGAEAEFRRASARLKQIGVNADAASASRTITMTAPMAGSVIDLAAAPGTYWNDVTATLMTIADLSTVWVTASVPESDTSLVTKGQAVDVTFAAYPGQVFKGEVLFVSDVLDPDTRRTKVRIAFPNPDARLKPGMFATVDFIAPTQNLPVVPASALILKDDATQVFVESAPWRFEAHNVDIAFQQGEQTVIRNGLKAGDRVVTRGGVLLGD